MRVPRAATLTTLAAVLFAADTAKIWETKDFKAWTIREAQLLTSDSPWAKQVPLPAGARPAMTVVEPGADVTSPPTAALGNPSNTATGTNMSVSGSPGSAGPADPNGLHSLSSAQTPSGVAPSAGAPEPARALTIIWASATPVRLAVLKLRSGPNTPTDAEIENTMKPRPNYVVAVSGLPAPDRDYDPTKLAKNTSLTVKGKTVGSNESTYRKIGDSDVYFFRFTRASFPITLSGQQVEFKMKLGSIELRKKFDLKDMQYKGQLAL